jgi:gliding motility-associated-like protein
VVVVIDVIPNLPPIAVDDTASVVTGNTVDIDVQGNDSDPESGPLTTTSATAGNGTVVINGNGTITYTPNAGFCGTDTITYTVCDDAGFCDSAIVLVQVLCPPLAVDDAVSTNEDTSVVIDPLDNDTDGNGDVLDISSATAGNGTVTINDDGTITYVPNPNYCGTDTITYTVCDGSGLCDTGIIVVTVVCVNDPPIAVDDVANTGEGDPVTVDVTDNDSDVDGDILTVTNATAGNGTVVINGNGTITYTPNEGFCGTDTITYTVCDPGPLCDQAIVVVTVACDPNEVLIPQGFSPNGDGIGDTWVITGLELYPQASVQIFNRYGNVVYEATPYTNDWDGTNTNGLSVGDQLPIGTYWYILDPGTGDEPWSGYVYLNR